MKPSFGSAYLDDNNTQFNTIHCILFMLSTSYGVGQYLENVVIDIIIRARNIVSGLVKVTVTSPAGLMKFFLNVEPCRQSSFKALSLKFETKSCWCIRPKLQLISSPNIDTYVLSS